MCFFFDKVTGRGLIILIVFYFILFRMPERETATKKEFDIIYRCHYTIFWLRDPSKVPTGL